MCASPRGAPAAILAFSSPRIDARAYLEGVCPRRFGGRRNFVRECSRVILADSPLKTELPGVFKGPKFGATRGKACFEMRQLVYWFQLSTNGFQLEPPISDRNNVDYLEFVWRKHRSPVLYSTSAVCVYPVQESRKWDIVQDRVWDVLYPWRYSF